MGFAEWGRGGRMDLIEGGETMCRRTQNEQEVECGREHSAEWGGGDEGRGKGLEGRGGYRVQNTEYRISSIE
jgi:hypothetical protein